MQKTIGIFEAKTKLSELCMRAEEAGTEYVITKRGRPVARLSPVGKEEADSRSDGILARMRRTAERHGAISDEKKEFPDVWKNRRGIRNDPLQTASKRGVKKAK